MDDLENEIKRYFEEKGLSHDDLCRVGLVDVQRLAMGLAIKLEKELHWVEIRRKMSEYINNEIRGGVKHD